MSDIKPHPRKSQADLTREWDRLAQERHRQISSGEDVSFENVVLPAVWRLFEPANKATVLDIGSGTGDFTARLAKLAGHVIAIEPSPASMTIARRVCRSISNVEFVESTLEQAAIDLNQRRVTSAVAVMTLMTTPDLSKFTRALATLLERGGLFVAIITHPWFWPVYWGYDKEAWFKYDREIFIEAPFRISRRRTEIKTTHVHRPLEQYVNVFAGCGLRLNALVEPFPPSEVQSLYPTQWQFPRFLGLRWEKVGS